MKSKLLKKIIALSITYVLILTLSPIIVHAKSKYNEIDSMTNVSYTFNNDIIKYEIGDIETLVYVDDTGKLYSSGNIDLLVDIDESYLDTLYYIDKNGSKSTIYGVDYITYTKENGHTYAIGNEPLNNGSTVITSDSNPTTSNVNKSITNTKNTGWIEDENGFQYVYSNGQRCYGWFKEGNEWYYFYVSTGYMTKNSKLKIDDKFYSFDSNGCLQENTDTNESIQKTGWVYDSRYGDERSGPTYDWRYVYSNGENHIGWLKDKGYWYYFEKCGHMLKNNIRKIDGKVYSFDSNGHMEVNTTRYSEYMETNLNTTWPRNNGFLYNRYSINIVINSEGICTITLRDGGYINVGNILCSFHSHITSDGSYHSILFDKNGDQVIGWYPITIYTWLPDSKSFSTNQKWTYYGENGIKITDTSKIIDGKTYSFDKDGYLL